MSINSPSIKEKQTNKQTTKTNKQTKKNQLTVRLLPHRENKV